jgi:uncharacterized protein
MQLNLHQNRIQNAIKACDQHGINIDDSVYQCSLLVGRDSLHTDWPVTTMEQLDLSLLQPVIDARPEILLIGTGRQQQLPDVNLLQALLQHNIVAEFMHTAAACRTFNILLDEERDVMAALIWQADTPSDSVAPHCA